MSIFPAPGRRPAGFWRLIFIGILVFSFCQVRSRAWSKKPSSKMRDSSFVNYPTCDLNNNKRRVETTFRNLTRALLSLLTSFTGHWTEVIPNFWQYLVSGIRVEPPKVSNLTPFYQALLSLGPLTRFHSAWTVATKIIFLDNPCDWGLWNQAHFQ